MSDNPDETKPPPPDAIPCIESQSFVAWLINTQRWRRDDVGTLSGQFARDENIRVGLRYATHTKLYAYLCERRAQTEALAALDQAYNEWCTAWGWYFGGQTSPAPQPDATAENAENAENSCEISVEQMVREVLTQAVLDGLATCSHIPDLFTSGELVGCANRLNCPQ